MAHSQFIRFMVPSGFLVGTATKPCVVYKKHKTSTGNLSLVASVSSTHNDMEINLRCRGGERVDMIMDNHAAAYKWMVFSPGFALLGQSAKSDARHYCSSTPPCGKKQQPKNTLIIQIKLSTDW